MRIPTTASEMLAAQLEEYKSDGAMSDELRKDLRYEALWNLIIADANEKHLQELLDKIDVKTETEAIDANFEVTHKFLGEMQTTWMDRIGLTDADIPDWAKEKDGTRSVQEEKDGD